MINLPPEGFVLSLAVPARLNWLDWLRRGAGFVAELSEFYSGD
jgi:hypothetical protein